jgi:Holliday junction resolvasome RuvABC DNA-binding subunit
MIVLSNILKQIRDKENRVTKDSIKTLNTDILKRIQKIGNKDAVRFFFDLLKELIETLGQLYFMGS